MQTTGDAVAVITLDEELARKHGGAPSFIAVRSDSISMLTFTRAKFKGERRRPGKPHH